MLLPITVHSEEILEAVRKNPVTIVVGETASGKTTQIPQFLYHAGFAQEGIIGITEPRRVAATSTAAFVAGQIGIRLGGLVGYQTRFDDVVAPETQIKFMTDGILLREFQIDPDIRNYSVIMVDEAHERSCNIDFVLGLLKNLLKRRPDLKVVVASATIDEEKFSRYFWDAPIINVSGRMFPVEIIYSDCDIGEWAMVDSVVKKIAEICENESPGDILVFMTGEAEINAVIERLEKQNLNYLKALPVYAALPPEEQQKIFSSQNGSRKVVVATNIAETSITIEGIRFVVDSGLVKQIHFHPESGIQSLDVVPHSQAGCEQRKGRAGRTQSGICYRMYTPENFESRPAFTTPEILRSSLASVVLAMEDISIENIEEFDFIDAPSKDAFHEAYETLSALGAIQRGKKGLTEIGQAMARLPLEPRVARMLLEAHEHECVRPVTTIAAFLSVHNIFVRPKDKEQEANTAHWRFKHSWSDFLTFLNIWKGYKESGSVESWCFENFLNAKSLWEVSNIREQLFRILDQEGIEISEKDDPDVVAKAVASGLVYNLLEHSSRFEYAGVLRPDTQKVYIHPSSTLFGFSGRWVVAAEIVKTTKRYARACSRVKPEWLPELVPNLASFQDPVIDSYTPGEEWVTARQEIHYRGSKVEEIKIQVDLARARQIQEAAVLRASQEGLIPLRFRRETILHLGTYDLRLVARRDGVDYTTWSSSPAEEDVTYFCQTEDFVGEHYATPVFRLFDLPADYPSGDQSPSPASLESLAQKWGATLSEK